MQGGNTLPAYTKTGADYWGIFIMNSDNTINVIYNDIFTDMMHELNIPLYISGSELTEALLTVYAQSSIVEKEDYSVVSFNPAIVICGEKSIKSFGLMNGSIISLKKINN